MPRIRRARTIDAHPEALWDLISDPHHLPRWWPQVQRVEDASAAAWTKVLTTPRGRPVRADYTRVRAQRPHTLVWRQEVDESPFERILSEAVTEFVLEPAGDGATRVEVAQTQRLRGTARFGALMVRRAARRQLGEALDGLAEIAERRP